MNTLQATTLPTEANVINIIFGSQNGLHPLCQSHSSIYLFFSRGRLRSSQVAIWAHCQTCFGWGALRWVPDVHFPTGCQWTETIPAVKR